MEGVEAEFSALLDCAGGGRCGEDAAVVGCHFCAVVSGVGVSAADSFAK